MVPVLSAISLIQTALGVVSSFRGTPQLAKVNNAVQDAMSIVKALTPLVTQFAGGKDVTPEDVRNALAGKNEALAEFDRVIVEKAQSAAGYELPK